jgi:hypothetical protein
LRATDGERRPEAGTAQTLTVALEATGPCWVSAVVDGVEVMARELAAGDRRVLEVTRDIELKIGDPGALQVTLNGVRTRPLGTAGQTVTRRFTPASFQQYLATP